MEPVDLILISFEVLESISMEKVVSKRDDLKCMRSSNLKQCRDFSTGVISAVSLGKESYNGLI